MVILLVIGSLACEVKPIRSCPARLLNARLMLYCEEGLGDTAALLVLILRRSQYIIW